MVGRGSGSGMSGCGFKRRTLMVGSLVIGSVALQERSGDSRTDESKQHEGKEGTSVERPVPRASTPKEDELTSQLGPISRNKSD